MVEHTPRTAAGQANANVIDEQGRTGLVDLLPLAQPRLVDAFDITDIDSPRVSFGRNGQAGAPS